MRPPAPASPRSKLSLSRLLLVALTLSSAAFAQSAFVRVNQVGYVSGAAKRAYLMASGVESGAGRAIGGGTDSNVPRATLPR